MKAFALLQAFRAPDEHVTSAELSRRAGLSAASGHRLIQTLEAVGAVVRDRGGRYRPSLILATSGKRAPPLAEVLADVSQDVLEPLANRFGATVQIGILEHGMVTYVAKASAPTSVPVPTRVGAQQEAYCSAIGKVLLAALSGPELEDFLQEGELIPLTERTITDRGVFREELERVRRDGFALDSGEAHPHLACVAVPVHDEGAHTVAALSMVDRIASMDAERRADARTALALAAGSISRKFRDARAGSNPSGSGLRSGTGGGLAQTTIGPGRGMGAMCWGPIKMQRLRESL